jgi:hypothetical protein
MIDLKKLRLFPFSTDNLALTETNDRKFYNIIFFPENSSFIQAYSKLRIKRQFVRQGTVIPAAVPRLALNPATLSPMYSNKLIPVKGNRKNIRNMYVDTSMYLDMLDVKYDKQSYRRPIVAGKMFPYLKSAISEYPNRSNILMYYVDLTRPIPAKLVNRRAFILYAMFKSKNPIPFDYVIIATNNGSTTSYTVVKTPDQQIGYARIFSHLSKMTSIISDDISNQETEETQAVADRITSAVDVAVGDLSEKAASPKVQVAIKQYIETLPSEQKDAIISSSYIDPENAKRLLVKASVYGMTKDMDRAKRVAKNIKPEQLDRAIKTIKRDIAPTILEKSKYKNEARDPVYKNTNINSVTENKNPSAVLSKRNVDFKQSFESDLKKSFEILARKKKFPLTVKSINKAPVPVDPGDLEPTKMIKYTIQLQEKNKKVHDIEIEIPQIQDDGTFLINGTKKLLIYQTVVDPIFFFKPGEAALTTMYAPVATHWKKTKHKSYFVSQIGGYWLPTSLLLSYHMGD